MYCNMAIRDSAYEISDVISDLSNKEKSYLSYSCSEYEPETKDSDSDDSDSSSDNEQEHSANEDSDEEINGDSKVSDTFQRTQ